MSLFESIESSADAPPAGPIPPFVRRAAMLEHPTLAVAAIQQGRIRQTNGPWQQLFALPTGVSVESHVATLFPNAGSADRFERSLQAEFSPSTDVLGMTARAEHMLMRRDGSAFLAEIVVRLSGPDDAKSPLSADAIWQVRDITVERALRRELRDLEEYHRELSRHQGDLTFVIDRRGRISYASSSIETALGYRVHAMLGEPFASFLEPEHAAEAEQWLRASTRQPSATPASAVAEGFLLHVIDGDGALRVLACRTRDCFAIPRIAGMVVHARDVTDTVRDEAGVAAADESARRLRSSLLALADAPRESPDVRIDALLRTVREELKATVATCWTAARSDGRRSWSARSVRDDAPDAGAPTLARDPGARRPPRAGPRTRGRRRRGARPACGPARRARR